MGEKRSINAEEHIRYAESRGGSYHTWEMNKQMFPLQNDTQVEDVICTAMKVARTAQIPD